ncbi:MAG TPA: hypothetical protein VD907_04760 [Verrucomicrobiae bacterium]|nr:hypothetical protein [Verrucomicrobiae bacterium]
MPKDEFHTLDALFTKHAEEKYDAQAMLELWLRALEVGDVFPAERHKIAQRIAAFHKDTPLKDDADIFDEIYAQFYAIAHPSTKPTTSITAQWTELRRLLQLLQAKLRGTLEQPRNSVPEFSFWRLEQPFNTPLDLIGCWNTYTSRIQHEPKKHALLAYHAARQSQNSKFLHCRVPDFAGLHEQFLQLQNATLSTKDIQLRLATIRDMLAKAAHYYQQFTPLDRAPETFMQRYEAIKNSKEKISSIPELKGFLRFAVDLAEPPEYRGMRGTMARLIQELFLDLSIVKHISHHPAWNQIVIDLENLDMFDDLYYDDENNSYYSDVSWEGFAQHVYSFLGMPASYLRKSSQKLPVQAW